MHPGTQAEHEIYVYIERSRAEYTGGDAFDRSDIRERQGRDINVTAFKGCHRASARHQADPAPHLIGDPQRLQQPMELRATCSCLRDSDFFTIQNKARDPFGSLSRCFAIRSAHRKSERRKPEPLNPTGAAPILHDLADVLRV